MHALLATYLEGIAVERHVHEVARLQEAHNELLLVGSTIRLAGRVAWVENGRCWQVSSFVRRVCVEVTKASTVHKLSK